MPELITGGLGDPTDRGDADPQVAAALGAFAAGHGSEHATLAALGRARLLVPVVALLAEAAPGDGTAAGPGLSAYDVASGRLQAVTTARNYSAVYALPSGTLLAIAADNPRLSFFDSSLRQVGTEDTNLNVVEVY